MTPVTEIVQRSVEAHAAFWRAQGCEVTVERGRCVVVHPVKRSKP